MAAQLGLPQHVLRFWETRFPQIKPLKRAGGRRYYRPEDVEALRAIKERLYDQGYTIKGVQTLIRAHGLSSLREAPESPVAALEERDAAAPAHESQEQGEGHPHAPSISPSLAAMLRQALDDINEAKRVLALAADR